MTAAPTQKVVATTLLGALATLIAAITKGATSPAALGAAALTIAQALAGYRAPNKPVKLPRPKPKRPTAPKHPSPKHPALVAMFDSVTASEIPERAFAAACYIDGDYANETAVKARKPKHLITITVHGHAGARACDCENGDLSPARAAAWAKAEINAGRQLPWVYCAISSAPTVLRELAKLNIQQDEIVLWSAHYNGKPHICGPHTCGFSSVAADLTQWTDKALGRNLDESLCQPAIFES